MKQMHILKKTLGLLTVMSLAGLCLTGCGSKQLTACQEQNQLLMQRISELEYQLVQSEQAAIDQTADKLMTGTYLVVEGDTLWRIAQTQLGDGKRFKEILALNPQMTKETPLSIGTVLRMPPR